MNVGGRRRTLAELLAEAEAPLYLRKPDAEINWQTRDQVR